ncbi:MAG: hypothetical protein AAF726_21215 [Planctomycetota bacterium]
MNCDECHGVGTIASNRPSSCGRCGGSGRGAALDVACMECGGSGQSSLMVRDTCWKCGGGGYLPDPPSPRATREESAPGRPAASATPSKRQSKRPSSAPSADSTTVRSSGSSKGAIVGLSLLVGGAAGFAEYSSSSATPDAVATGAIVFGVVGVALVVLVFVVKILLQLAKVAIPVGALLVVGNLMEWEWAQATTQWLRTAGGEVVVAAEKAWSQAESSSSEAPR